MTGSINVAWTIRDFPVDLRKRFVCAAKEVGFTTPALLEEVVKGWFTGPSFPEPESEIPEGTEISHFNVDPFPLRLKDRFVAQAGLHSVNVPVLLAHVLEQYFSKLNAATND